MLQQAARQKEKRNAEVTPRRRFRSGQPTPATPSILLESLQSERVLKEKRDPGLEERVGLFEFQLFSFFSQYDHKSDDSKSKDGEVGGFEEY